MSENFVGLNQYEGNQISKGFKEVTLAEGIKYLDGLLKAFLDIPEERLEKAISEREDVTEAGKKAAEKEYGDVSYADEKNKKYPLDAKHIRAAVSYWGMQKNRSKYSPEEQKTISRKIGNAARKLGIKTDLGKEE